MVYRVGRSEVAAVGAPRLAAQVLRRSAERRFSASGGAEHRRHGRAPDVRSEDRPLSVFVAEARRRRTLILPKAIWSSPDRMRRSEPNPLTMARVAAYVRNGAW
jgi:hypothetical protein